jgi:hypothetical protein
VRDVGGVTPGEQRCVAAPGSIPVLATSRRLGVCLGLRFRKRRRREGPVSDRLVCLWRDEDAVVSVFASLRFEAESTGAVTSQVLDLDDSSADFCLKSGLNLCGDSLSLPILLALHLTRTGSPWPAGVYASGAIRASRGYRCAAVAGARSKLRLLEWLGYRRLFLPQKNCRELRLAGFDLQRTASLPTSVPTCLQIWDSFLQGKP